MQVGWGHEIYLFSNIASFLRLFIKETFFFLLSIEDVSAPTDWLVAKWGDVYLHETVISHIRRLLDTRFTCEHLHETAAQLTERMTKALLGQFQFFMTCGGND